MAGARAMWVVYFSLFLLLCWGMLQLVKESNTKPCENCNLKNDTVDDMVLYSEVDPQENMFDLK